MQDAAGHGARGRITSLTDAATLDEALARSREATVVLFGSPADCVIYCQGGLRCAGRCAESTRESASGAHRVGVRRPSRRRRG